MYVVLSAVQEKSLGICLDRIHTRVCDLTRNSRQPTAAGAHLPHFAKAMWGRPESTALGSDKGLDVL